jgi:hypothetical protein
MSGVEHAREMITLAQRDFKALQGMLDVETFADEIFERSTTWLTSPTLPCNSVIGFSRLLKGD